MAKQKSAPKAAEEETPKAKGKGKAKAAAAEPAPAPAPAAKTKAKPKAKAAAAPAAKPKTKSELLAALATKTGLERKQVAEFFEALAAFIKEELGDDGPGVVKMPGLFKIERKIREATPETQKPNPFKPGEMMTVKAKPAKKDVKVRPLKELKEMVN